MKLEKSKLSGDKTVQISGSKSISNRLLILNHLFDNQFFQIQTLLELLKHKSPDAYDCKTLQILEGGYRRQKGDESQNQQEIFFGRDLHYALHESKGGFDGTHPQK